MNVVVVGVVFTTVAIMFLTLLISPLDCLYQQLKPTTMFNLGKKRFK